VAALTVYACNTEEDFTTKMGMSLVLFVCLIMLGLVTLFVQSSFLENLYCCLGVLFFGFYLVIDTQMIMGGKHFELAIDEYVLAAMLLYIDIIQIFLYILRLLGSRR
jgi:protein lifeguard